MNHVNSCNRYSMMTAVAAPSTSSLLPVMLGFGHPWLCLGLKTRGFVLGLDAQSVQSCCVLADINLKGPSSFTRVMVCIEA